MSKLAQARVKRAVSQFMDDLQWAFDFQNLDRRIVFDTQPFAKSKEVCARVDFDFEYRRLYVYIHPCFFENTPADQRGYLLHEFCHVFTSDLYGRSINLLNGKLESFDALTSCNETATSRITQVIGALLQGRMRYARKGYNDYVKALTPKSKSIKQRK